MKESGDALCKKHGFSPEEHAKYIEKIMNRFRNPYIKDDVARVGREPVRKLGPADRLVGPAKMADEFGLPKTNLLKAIAACLLYDNPEDNQSVQLKKDIKEKGLEEVIEDVLGFKKGGDESKLVVVAYNELKG